MKMRTASVSEALIGWIHFITAVVVRFWHGLISDRADGYCPERHYMRGPGPKWREKHGGNL